MYKSTAVHTLESIDLFKQILNFLKGFYHLNPNAAYYSQREPIKLFSQGF